jgi:hypothetical protein
MGGDIDPRGVVRNGRGGVAASELMVCRLRAGGNGILTIGPPEATAFYTSRFDPGLLSFRAGKRCRSSDGPRVRIRCTEPPTIAFYGHDLSQATKAGGDADAHDEQAALLE